MCGLAADPKHLGGSLKKCGGALGRTGQDRTGQDRIGQDRTGQDRTGQEIVTKSVFSEKKVDVFLVNLTETEANDELETFPRSCRY